MLEREMESCTSVPQMSHCRAAISLVALQQLCQLPLTHNQAGAAVCSLGGAVECG